MKLLLVVCTGNICRSPMAEALLARRLREAGLSDWLVESRGVGAVVGHGATLEAQLAAEELGLDLEAHRGRQITAQDAGRASLILALERWQRDAIRKLLPQPLQQKVQLLTHYQASFRDRDIADPYGEPLEVFRECLAEIRSAVEAVVSFLREEASRPPAS